MSDMGFRSGGFRGFGARQGAAGAAAATVATTEVQGQGTLLPAAESPQQVVAATPRTSESAEEPPHSLETETGTQAPAQLAPQAAPKAVLSTPAPQASAPPTTSTALAVVTQDAPSGGLVRWSVGGLSIDLGELGIDVTRPLSALNDNDAMKHLGVALPLVKIEYLKTQEAIDARRIEGYWTSHTGEQKQVLDVVLVLMSFQRMYQAAYDPDAKEQARPICRSLDGVHGVGSQKAGIQEGQTCATCRYSKWTTVRDERGKERRTQPCADTFALLLHERDWGPIMWFVRRTGIPLFRKFNGTLGAKAMQIRGARLRGDAPDVPVVNLLGRFTLATQKTPTHFLPVFGSVEATDEERIVEIAQALPLYVALRERLKSVDIDLPVDDEPEEHPADDGGRQANGASTSGGWGNRGTETPSASQQQQGGATGAPSRLAGSAFSRQGR